jgi:hypothetical protein
MWMPSENWIRTDRGRPARIKRVRAVKSGSKPLCPCAGIMKTRGYLGWNLSRGACRQDAHGPCDRGHPRGSASNSQAVTKMQIQVRSYPRVPAKRGAGSRLRFLVGLVALAAALCLLVALPGHGQERKHTFRCERAILPGGPGPNRLEIDTALLAAANPFLELSHEATGADQQPMIIGKNGLGDLRIYDSSNREVPYLLIAPPSPAPRWVDARLLPIAATRKTSGFEADLGRLIAIDRLQLGGLAAPFLKRAQLEGSGDRNRWAVLVTEGTLFDLPAEKLKHLELEFDPGEYRYLRLTFDDSASARVSLPESVSARLVTGATLPPAVRIALQYERRNAEPGASRYRIHLPGPHMPVAAIELTSAGRNVLRRARVVESRLQNAEMVPQMLGISTLWHSVQGEASTAELRIPITPPQEAELELIIHDGDNPPLDLTGISAVLAYLPWIYFESSGKEPLTARFGNRELVAPQYDLEATRDSAAKLRTVQAHWGEFQKPAVLAEASFSSAVSAGAVINTNSFLYSRPIPTGKTGLNALLLDVEVLAHTHMTDLRIAGPDGRQIPYLLERLDAPITVELPAPQKIAAPPNRGGSNPSAPGARSYYRLLFPYPNLPASRLMLTTSARVFRRDLHIFKEHNPANERQGPWTAEIASTTWSHTDPDTTAPPAVMKLESLGEAESRLMIEEGDNSPLPLESARLLLPSYRLRFFRTQEAGLKLYYGNEKLADPIYDIALLAPQLVGAVAEEISLPPGNAAAALMTRTKSFQTTIFWIILGLAVLALFFMIARLITKGAAEGNGQ